MVQRILPTRRVPLLLQQTVDALQDPVPETFARDFQAGTVYQPLPADFTDCMVAASLKLPARVARADGRDARDRPPSTTRRPPDLDADPLRRPGRILPAERTGRLSGLLPTATLKVCGDRPCAPLGTPGGVRARP
jgi:hypothetical protein